MDRKRDRRERLIIVCKHCNKSMARESLPRHTSSTHKGQPILEKGEVTVKNLFETKASSKRATAGEVQSQNELLCRINYDERLTTVILIDVG